jgi:hypothetical protein
MMPIIRKMRDAVQKPVVEPENSALNDEVTATGLEEVAVWGMGEEGISPLAYVTA